MERIDLLIIDPQVDFCDPNGSLYVPGADDDMKRLAKMIDRIGSKISQIHVTLDCHHPFCIFHSPFWINSKGEHPAPFTIISTSDVKNSVWRPFFPQYFKKALNYVETLEKTGKYQLIIWPTHCLIGSEGSNVYPELFEALCQWEENKPWVIDYVSKGANVFTENYSAIKSECPDPNDPSTQLNTRLIDTLIKADTILVAGEAGSHCLKLTVEDIAETFNDPSYIKKIVLLTDATSPVQSPVVDFPAIQDAFIKDMTAKGMRVSTTVDFLA